MLDSLAFLAEAELPDAMAYVQTHIRVKIERLSELLTYLDSIHISAWSCTLQQSNKQRASASARRTVAVIVYAQCVEPVDFYPHRHGED